MFSDVIIMAGGAGTRLWPASSKKIPKQYLPIFGDKTFFDLSLERAYAVLDARSSLEDHKETEPRLVIIAASSHIEKVSESVSRRSPKEQERTLLVSEPLARNTAAAMACALALIQKSSGPGRRALVLTCDHLINPMESFIRDVARSEALAKEGWLCVFGIPPTYPSSGFGYIEQGHAIGGHEGCYAVEGFREKPDEQTAREFLKSGTFSWNSGMFAFSIDDLIASFDEYAPRILAPFMGLGIPEIRKNKGNAQLAVWEGLEEAYRTSPATSFDYAIAEKARHRALIPASFTWRDIGSWDDWAAMRSEEPGMKESLVDGVIGATVSASSSNCFVDSDIPVALYGVEDLIVVIRRGEDGNPRALVCRKGESQGVKELVEELKRQERDDIL